MLQLIRLLASVAFLSTVSASPRLVPRGNSSTSGGLSPTEGQWSHGGSSDVHSAIVNTTGNEPASSDQAQLLSAPVASYGGKGASAYHGPAWISSGHGLRPSLSQSQTNGGCQLGTLNASTLPDFVNSGPMPQGKPWGDRTCKDTNVYDDTPNTGMTRHYDFTISEMVIAPDGVEKKGVVVNGQFPGPTIEANWGGEYHLRQAIPQCRSIADRRQTGSKSSSTTSLAKAQQCIGMVFCRKTHPGWTEFQESINAPLLQDRPSPIASEQISMAAPGTTVTIQLSTQAVLSVP